MRFLHRLAEAGVRFLVAINDDKASIAYVASIGASISTSSPCSRPCQDRRRAIVAGARLITPFTNLCGEVSHANGTPDQGEHFSSQASA